MATAKGSVGDEWIDEAFLKLRRSAFWRFNRMMLFYIIVSVYLLHGLFLEVLWVIWVLGNSIISVRLLSRLARRFGFTSAELQSVATEIIGPRATTEVVVVRASSATRRRSAPRVHPGGWTLLERWTAICGALGATLGIVNQLFPGILEQIGMQILAGWT